MLFCKVYFIMKSIFLIFSMLFRFCDYHSKIIIMYLNEIFLNKCNLTKPGNGILLWWHSLVLKLSYMAMPSIKSTLFRYKMHFLRSVSKRYCRLFFTV